MYLVTDQDLSGASLFSLMFLFEPTVLQLTINDHMHLSQTLVYLNTPVDPARKLALGNKMRYVGTVMISGTT
jgi:hypothetical protein